jgi:hypothetical protein
MTAYNRLTGTLKLPNQVVKQLEDMGFGIKTKSSITVWVGLNPL